MAGKLSDLAIDDMQNLLEEGDVTILYHRITEDGACIAVYEIDGVRRYRAMEYVYNDELQGGVKRLPDFGYWEQSCGYDTSEKYHYMGERYRGLFGPYESEVFYTVK